MTNVLHIDHDIIQVIFKPIKEGEKLRREGGTNPYLSGSLFACLSAYGWVREDLRIALMKADPAYAASQEAFGNGLDKVKV